MLSKYSKYKDTIIGIVVILLTAAYYYASLSIEDRGFTGSVTSASIPQWLCYGMWILSAALIIKNQRNVKKGETKSEGKKKTRNRKAFVIACVAILLYVILIPTLGFCPSTVLFLMLMFYALSTEEERNYPLFLVISIATALITYLIFRNYLNLMLPKGIMPF